LAKVGLVLNDRALAFKMRDALSRFSAVAAAGFQTMTKANPRPAVCALLTASVHYWVRKLTRSCASWPGDLADVCS
jgi:hypothetical protein